MKYKVHLTWGVAYPGPYMVWSSNLRIIVNSPTGVGMESRPVDTSLVNTTISPSYAYSRCSERTTLIHFVVIGVGDGVVVSVAVGVCVGVGVRVVGVVNVGVGVEVGIGVFVAVATGVGVGVEVRVFVAVATDVGISVTVATDSVGTTSRVSASIFGTNVGWHAVIAITRTIKIHHLFLNSYLLLLCV